jgi:hypothetical protein
MKDDFNSTYKRLTRRDENKIAELIDEDVDIEAAEQNALERLAELEDMIQNGKLVMLPCGIGEEIFYNGHNDICRGLYYSDKGWDGVDIGKRLFHFVPLEHVYTIKKYEDKK